MSSEALKAFFRFGVLITVLSVLILFAQTPGSAEFVVTVLSIGIGLALMALVAWAARSQ